MCEWKKSRVWMSFIGFSCAAILASQPAQTFAGKQVALLIGVGKWKEGSNVPKTMFTESDMAQLSKLLKKGGYQVTLMTTEAAQFEFSPNWPSRDKILKMLEDLAKQTDVDQFLVVCASHGVMHVTSKRNFILPADATLAHSGAGFSPEKDCHLIDFDELFKKLDASTARHRFLFVDACRMESIGLDPAFDVQTNQAPQGKTIAFYSCKAKETAKEDTKARRSSYFSYYLMQAMKGRPRKFNQNVLTMGTLEDYVTESVGANSIDQHPELYFDESVFKAREIRGAPIMNYISAGAAETIDAGDLPTNINDWPTRIRRKEGARTIVEDVTFTGDFKGTNLSWITFKDCKFKDCRFLDGVNVTNARMIDCEFDNADFSGNRGLQGLQIYGFENSSFRRNLPWHPSEGEKRPGKILNSHFESFE